MFYELILLLQYVGIRVLSVGVIYAVKRIPVSSLFRFFSRLCLSSVSLVILCEFQHNFLSHWRTFCDWEMRESKDKHTKFISYICVWMNTHTLITRATGPRGIQIRFKYAGKNEYPQSQPDTQAYKTKCCIETGCKMQTVNTFS